MLNNKHLFALNIPITIRLNSGEYILIKTPNIEEYETFLGYRILAEIFLTEVGKIMQMSEELGFSADTYIDLFSGFQMILKRDNPNGMENGMAIEALNRLCGVTVENNGPRIGNYLLSEEDMLLIREVFLISLRKADIEEEAEESSVNEHMSKVSEAQAKIDRIKRNKAKVSESRETAWTDVIVMLIHYLGVSITEIKKLNYYGLHELYIYASRVPTDRIASMAASNGNGIDTYKDITHFRGE